MALIAPVVDACPEKKESCRSVSSQVPVAEPRAIHVVDRAGASHADLGGERERLRERDRFAVHDRVDERRPPPAADAGQNRVEDGVSVGGVEPDVRVQVGVGIDRLRHRDAIDRQELVLVARGDRLDLAGRQDETEELGESDAPGDEHAVHHRIDGEVLAVAEVGD